MLSEQQLTALTLLFRAGASDASLALSRWLERPASISIDKVEQLALADATGILGDGDAPITACVMSLRGKITGQLILAFDDSSGLRLAELLLGRDRGTSTGWGEVERSAALETANIIGCAYLNAIARNVRDSTAAQDLLPSPPQFRQDFAESLLEFALMNQAMVSDLVFITQTEFRIDDSPLNWDLLFIPDAASLPTLENLLTA